jgi:glycerol-3-phosphate O-acyltransferase/dihydroxyacetone phosphate acyltransferase
MRGSRIAVAAFRLPCPTAHPVPLFSLVSHPASARIFRIMWSARIMTLISHLGIRAYYRVTISGARVPVDGPVLLVANHNNSLVDPALVVVAAGRQVRFLAKSTLFDDKLIGWLIRAVGSVPVYRQQDDPAKLAQNLDSFRDVHDVLADGDAVGIFPEGISHSAPQLAPLKTGAARIAIGAGQRIGHDFPIVVTGLVYRDRDVFRSEAHAIIPEPFRWDDLLAKGVTDREAVRELTHRIATALRSVTLNLARWEDEPLVRAAEEVWTAEFGAAGSGRPSESESLPEDNEAARIERLRVTTDALQALRSGGDPGWRDVAIELRAHMRQLRRLGLTPARLRGEARFSDAIEWIVPRIPLFVALPVSVSGAILFWAPKEITVRAADPLATKEGSDALVTHRILVGGVVFAVWIVLIALVVTALAGFAWGALSLLVQPVWAFAALAVGERRQQAWATIRRFFLRRAERPRLDALRERQRALADRLRSLYERVAAVGAAG